MTEPLGLERFKALLAAYGARPERFPDGEREAALALLAVSEEARALAQAEAALDDALSSVTTPALSPGLARRLAELPIRHPRAERRSRLGAVVTALGWAAAAAFGVIWGARAEAAESAADASAEQATTGSDDEPSDGDEELVELALGAVSQLEEEP